MIQGREEEVVEILHNNGWKESPFAKGIFEKFRQTEGGGIRQQLSLHEIQSAVDPQAILNFYEGEAQKYERLQEAYEEALRKDQNDEATASEQRIYEHYKAIEAENFHLKKQLKHANKDIKRLKGIIKYWKDVAKGKKPKKQHYKNGKRGTRSGR